jgi:hypothetical protein
MRMALNFLTPSARAASGLCLNRSRPLRQRVRCVYTKKRDEGCGEACDARRGGLWPTKKPGDES